MSEPIQYVPLESLSLWDENYRKGDVDAIIKSISQFGFNQALRVWRGTVVAGNHSLKALQALRATGWTPFGGGITETWEVAIVDVSHLTKTEAKAFAIADNRTSELALNDDEQLSRLLQELKEADEKLLASVGYNEEDLQALLDSLSAPDWDAAFDLPEGELEFKAITFNLHTSQYDLVRRAIDLAIEQFNEESPNSNKNGNALFLLARQFLDEC